MASPFRGSNQIVEGSIVFGSVNQLSGVKGNVSIVPDTAPDLAVNEFPTGPSLLSRDDARAQPSKLLNPKNQVVPFLERSTEAPKIREWLNSPDSLSIQLIHGPAGEGKTRLATQLAYDCRRDSWAVWQVASQKLSLSRPPKVKDGSRILAVVDYADRWPLSRLVSFIVYMHELTLDGQRQIRVLLLARSPGYWWTTLQDYCEKQLSSSTDQFTLSPITSSLRRLDTMHEAANSFASVLEVETDKVYAKLAYIDITGDAFANILTLHMTALAAVDAAWRGDDFPTDPSTLSSYLLRRERTHWQTLYTRQEDALRTPPATVARTVYVSALTDEKQRIIARELLIATGLADTVSSADVILDDHAYCYPPNDPTQVLTSLYPDRLAEDFIALTVPGHNVRNGWQADDWSIAAASKIVTSGISSRDDGVRENSQALTVLVETALRWPHVASGVLIPIIKQTPKAAISAGGNILEKILNLEIPVDVLTQIEELIPTSDYSDMDYAAAQISTFTAPFRLESASNPIDKVAIYVNQSVRLRKVSDQSGALGATSKALEIVRTLDTETEENSRYLAKVLLAHGFSYFNMGRFIEARRAFSEGIESIQPRLSINGGRIFELAELGRLYTGLTLSLAELGEYDEASTAAQNAVIIHRHLEADTPGYNQADLAGALSNYSNCLRRAGDFQSALAPIEEAIKIFETISTEETVGLRAQLGTAKTDLAALLIDLGQRRAALATLPSTIDDLTQLAHNYAARKEPLATALSCAAVAEALEARFQKALEYSSRAIEILHELEHSGSGEPSAQLARELSNHGSSLAALGRYAEAIECGKAALSRYHWLARGGYGLAPKEFATAYFNFASWHERLGDINGAIGAFHDGWKILDLIADPGQPDSLTIAYVGLLMSRLCLHLSDPPDQEITAIIEQSSKIYSSFLKDHPNDESRKQQSIEIEHNIKLMKSRPQDPGP